MSSSCSTRSPGLRRWRWSLLLSGLLLAASADADFFEIDNAGLEAELARQTLVVDVRRADEWRATGVIEGSHRVTFFDQLGRFDAEAWLGRLAEFTNPRQPIVLICETGGRSRVIGYWLSARLGFDRVYNLRDGIAGWLEAGLPVVAP